MQTGLIYHPDFLKHDTGHHPENKLRLIKTIEHFRKTGILPRLFLIPFKKTTEENLLLVHTQEQINYVKNSHKQNLAYLDPDTPISEDSYETALLAVGGVLETVRQVSDKNIKNAFCLIRPPGHHSTPARSMGFCLFNNASIAARYLQKYLNHQRILIIDWDAHHGNGTQEAFYDDPTVLYFSTHHYPFYPGTGSSEEKGVKNGFGYNINVPLPSGSGDSEYISAFENYLLPAVEKFKPEFILISAGFDAHIEDPLGGMAVTNEGFKILTKIVTDIAKKYCDNKIVSLLEGGYNLKTLPQTIAVHLEELISQNSQTF
ncbi:MAG: histone deacetylase [bacterium]